MKNKFIAILLFVPLIMVVAIFGFGAYAYGSVNEADRVILNHDILNPIRVGESHIIEYRTVPNIYWDNVVIESSDESILEVIEPTKDDKNYYVKALKEGEATVTAKFKDPKTVANDQVNFYAYTKDTNKLLVYDNIYNPNAIDKNVKYGEYDFDSNFNKIPAEFTLSAIDLSKLETEKDLPSRDVEVLTATNNLEVKKDGDSYKVKILADKNDQDESYIIFKSKKAGSDVITTYNVDVVDEAVNVYTYDDLLHCTNYSEVGEIIVLRSHLESAKNTFSNFDVDNVNKDIDIENSPRIKNTNFFGRVRKENGKNIYYAESMKIESTYDTKYLQEIKKKYPDQNIETTINVGINLKKSMYGNGFTLNMHSLTFPSGVTTTENGSIVYPIARDLFKGPLDFVAISFSQDGVDTKYKPIASVAGQDNIGLYVNGDNITIDNITIKSCNNVDYLSNLEYVGTTVEISGDNVLIEDSILQNGRNVVRSFSNKNFVIRNSLVRYARDFLIKVGSNTNYYSQAINDYPDWEGEDRYDNEITLDHVYTQRSGFFSIGVDTHFNGEYLIKGDEMFLNGVKNIGATSKGTKINLINECKFYDWKNYKELDTSTLIKIKAGIDEAIQDLIFQNFDVATMIKNALVGENAKFINKIAEPVLDKNGEIQLDDKGNIITEDIEYLHGGIAFYGGGKNYSVMLNEESLPSSHELLPLKNINLTGLLSLFAGNEPFNFYLYDKNASITPSMAPDIEELKDFALI